LTFDVVVPITATSGITRMRVMNVFGTTGLTPCGAYAYGETEDYDVEIVGASGNYCVPTASSGTASGDYINSLAVNNLNVVTGASSSPYYSNYTGFGGVWQANLTTGNFYSAAIGAGSYVTEYYTMWIDYNNDGDFNDFNEELGEVASTVANQTVYIDFTVPIGTSIGE
jgi:hypothetical protein